jgi:hypothetical protein
VRHTKQRRFVGFEHEIRVVRIAAGDIQPTVGNGDADV